MRKSQLSYIHVYGTDPSALPEDALKALPERYRTDDCLEYWQEDCLLCARPILERIPELGSWTMVFDSQTDTWEDTLC